MSTSTALRATRVTTLTTTLHRRLSTVTTTTPRPRPPRPSDNDISHAYLQPTPFLGSFPKYHDPKKAMAKLALLRRDYAKQFKEARKRFIEEMEVQREVKLRKDEAKKMELLRLNEERRKSKAVAAQARAKERKAFEEDFRIQLMKEKTEKLEYWRTRQNKILDRKNQNKELICKKSSEWIDEKDLESQIKQAVLESRIL